MPRTNLPLEIAQRLTAEFGTHSFSGAQAAAVGVSRHHLAGAIARGLLLRITRDQYVVTEQFEQIASDDDRHLSQCEAEVAAVRGSVISHESAAKLHGLPFGRDYRRRIEEGIQLTLPGRHNVTGLSGCRVSGSGLTSDEITVVAGLPVTTLARTAVDVARRHKLPDSLIILDATMRRLIAQDMDPTWDIRDAVHEKRFRFAARNQLRAVAKNQRRWDGIPDARGAITLAEPASESALESLSRFHMDGPFPPPLVGCAVRGASGKWYWVDFCWKEYRVIGEADGALKYTSREAIVAEKLREDDLRAAGWRVVRWGWDEGVRQPHIMNQRIDRALHQSQSQPETA